MPFRPFRSALVASAVVALTLGAAPVATIARSVGADPVSPRVNQITMWGWAVVRQPSTALYAPAAADHGGSYAGAAEVTRAGTGSYVVRLPGLSAESDPQGGVVHVTPIDPTPRHCRVLSWVATGSVDLAISVAC